MNIAAHQKKKKEKEKKRRTRESVVGGQKKKTQNDFRESKEYSFAVIQSGALQKRDGVWSA